MRIVERYIGRTLISHVLIVLLVLLSIYFFSTLMAEMGNVGKGSYSSMDAVIYSLMLLPRQAYELFPLVAMVGTILGIGSMASHNELTVLRAAGVSIKRLALAVMKTGTLLILIVLLIGEILAPYLEKQAHSQRLSALAKSVSLNASDGLWARDGTDFISISRLILGGQASGIRRYRFEGQQLIGIDYASQGQYEEGGWRVKAVLRTVLAPERVKTEYVEEELWPSTLTPEVVNVATIAPENLALLELFEFVDYLRENALATQHYETAMWVRLFTPLATGGMILLALPFVFGSLRGVTIGHRVMVGSLLGIGFYLVNGVFSRLGLIFDIDPLISAGTPTLLVYLIWFYMMRRIY